MATVEQTQAEFQRLVGLVQEGEEVLITKEGRPVARLTGLPPETPAESRQSWMEKLTRLREATAAGKTSPTTEDILEELRAERG